MSEMTGNEWIPWGHSGPTTVAQIPELEPDTDYEISIREVFQGIDPSEWSAPVTMSTDS